MNGGPAQVSGIVQRIDSTGIGVNSGEITIVILPDGGTNVVEVFAAILDSYAERDNAHAYANANEHGVYASFVAIALAAMTTGRRLSCTYVMRDKPRITGLTILQ